MVYGEPMTAMPVLIEKTDIINIAVPAILGKYFLKETEPFSKRNPNNKNVGVVPRTKANIMEAAYQGLPVPIAITSIA